MSKKINIISVDNGVGLSQDYLILRKLLLGIGYDVHFIDWQNHSAYRKADVNIFLELLNPRCFPLAKKNIFFPNAEWFGFDWLKYLKHLDLICCKTKDAVQIFSKHNKNCVHTSFTSIDKYDKNIVKKKNLLHIAGKSLTKQTAAIINAYINFNLPPLILTAHNNRWKNLASSKNIKAFFGVMDNNYVNKIQNTCLFHLCPSSYEGFGHYINEAKGCGTIILTVNAAPMNELITADFGILVKQKGSSRMALAELKLTNDIEIKMGIDRMMSIDDNELIRMSQASRASYIDNDSFFKKTFEQIIKSL